MLVGNHDMLNNKQYCDTEHALCSLKHMQGLTVVDMPTVVNMDKALSLEEPALICCPFIPKGRLSEALDEFLPQNFKNWREMSDDYFPMEDR